MIAGAMKPDRSVRVRMNTMRGQHGWSVDMAIYRRFLDDPLRFAALLGRLAKATTNLSIPRLV